MDYILQSYIDFIKQKEYICLYRFIRSTKRQYQSILCLEVKDNGVLLVQQSIQRIKKELFFKKNL